MADRTFLLRVVILGSALLAAACGASGLDPVRRALASGDLASALAAVDATPEGERRAALALVAARVLEDEAEAEPERRELAFAELARAGRSGVPVLESLARSPDDDVRTRALAALARRGDRGAARTLERDLDAADDARRARAIAARGSELDAATLGSSLVHPSSAVRAAAVAEAARRDDPAFADALLERARLDPVPAIRAAACRGAGRAAPEALLDLARTDAPAEVRAACLRAALPRLSPEARRAHVEALDSVVDEVTLELARAVRDAVRDDGEETVAMANERLATGLSAERPTIRAATAYALSASPSAAAALASHLASENAPAVRLALATVLSRSEEHRADAERALHDLVPLATLEGVQAAAALAASHDEAALARLRSSLTAEDPILRAAAVRGLAGTDAGSVAALLRDPVASVRLAAAGALL